MNIRRLEKQEIPAVLNLWNAAGAIPSVTDSQEDIAFILNRENAVFLVAEAEGEIVGSIIATFDGWRGHVYRLAVRPDRRREGIAVKLVKEAEKTLQSWGARRVLAIVERQHPWAMGFWSAAGYVNDSMTRFYRNL